MNILRSSLILCAFAAAGLVWMIAGVGCKPKAAANVVFEARFKLLVPSHHDLETPWTRTWQTMCDCIIPFAESHSLKQRSFDRVNALYPNLSTCAVRFKVRNTDAPALRVFVVEARGPNEEFVRHALDSLLDELQESYNLIARQDSEERRVKIEKEMVDTIKEVRLRFLKSHPEFSTTANVPAHTGFKDLAVEIEKTDSVRQAAAATAKTATDSQSNPLRFWQEYDHLRLEALHAVGDSCPSHGRPIEVIERATLHTQKQ